MKVNVSERIGFCFGVKKAVDLSHKALSENKKIFSAGPIIHNPQVVEDLLKKGITPVDNPSDITEGVIIISSHGAGAALKERSTGGKVRIIDATCPFVKRIQDTVKDLRKNDYRVIITGKKTHPEVKALVDVAEGRAVVIKDTKEAEELNAGAGKVGVVSQSTYSQGAFFEIVSMLLKKPFSEIRVFNTICRDAIKRQDSAKRLARKSDVVVIVGGRESSNTRRLAEVCRKEGKDVYHIEQKNEIDQSWFTGKQTVAVASGASTPDSAVKAVVEKIRRYC